MCHVGHERQSFGWCGTTQNKNSSVVSAAADVHSDEYEYLFHDYLWWRRAVFLWPISARLWFRFPPRLSRCLWSRDGPEEHKTGRLQRITDHPLRALNTSWFCCFVLCFSQYSPAAIILGNRSSSKHSYSGGMALHKWRLMAFDNSLTKKWCVLKMVLDPSSVGSVHPSAKRHSVNNVLTASINAIKASWFSCQARNNSSSGGNLSQPSSTVTSKQLVWR